MISEIVDNLQKIIQFNFYVDILVGSRIISKVIEAKEPC